MYTNIIGTQQILITAAFLGVMILLLIILRKKSTVIRASMKAGKRINVVEDAAVSPTERLRLVIIDSKEFVMVSAKGHAPSLIPLSIANCGKNISMMKLLTVRRCVRQLLMRCMPMRYQSRLKVPVQQSLPIWLLK